MSRGIDFNKLTGSPMTRDWQNIPVQKINKAVKNMPRPGELDPQAKKVLVNFYVNQSTVRFFKKEANLYGAKYQRMMRAVLELYKRSNL